MTACEACGQENPDVARFCLACGAALAPPRRGAGEERKVVTVLFCDLVGFTALSERADPEDVRATLHDYHARLQEQIERFGGTLEKFIGDAVVAVFGAPVTHEDDPERAVRCAFRILEAIADLNRSRPGPELAVRIGVNTGEAVVSLGTRSGREGMVAGDVVNTASRLQGIAPVGGVVVGEGTYRATRDLFEFERLEPAELKGKERPVAVWRGHAPRSRFGADVEVRPPTPFVGREDELDVLARAFVRMQRERSPHLVTVIGEPGVGKSRLVREFFQFVDARPELVFWRQGRCLPYGEGITFWALGEIVKAQAGILESDDPREASDKLARTLEALAEDPGEREWLAGRLAPLVGLVAPEAPDRADRLESFSAWRRLFELMAQVHPLILVVEDLHWADPAMLDFLEHLLDWSVGTPVLLVCTARPELFERRPGWGGGKRNSTTLSLAPLGDEQIRKVVSALLPGRSLPASVQERLLERAEGNPLYAEEFARMLADRPSWAGRPEVGAPWEEGSVPESIHALIAARIDTLAPDLKGLLQDASVVGKVFWSGALAYMGGIEEDRVREGLHALTLKELVRPARTSSVRDQAEFSFWHFLIGEVAYSQIPRAARARKHRLAAEWTQALAGDRVADVAEVLAHHYRRALHLARAANAPAEASQVEGPARAFLVAAGDRAMSLDARRAAQHYRDALELFPPGDPEALRVLVRAAEAEGRAGLFAEAAEKYERAVAGLRATGSPVEVGGTLVRLANLLWYRGETARSRELLAEAIELLEREPPGPELARAYAEQTIDQFLLGRFEEARAWGEKALRMAREVGAEDQVPAALEFRGTARWVLGDPGGLDDIRRALDMSLRLGLSRQSARIHVILTELLWLAEGPEASLETARAGIELAERRGNAEMAMANRQSSLDPLIDLGRWREALTIAERLTRWSRAAGERYLTTAADMRKARILALRGEVGEAARLVEAFLPAAREIADPQVLVIALAVAALVRWAEGDVEEAVRLVREVEAATRGRPGWYRAFHLPDLVRVCAAAGQVELAEELAAHLPVHARRHRLNVATARAVLAEARGERAGAALGYDGAAEGWREFGNVLEEGQVLLGAARCRLEADPAGAAQRLARAEAIFDRLGAAPLREEARSLLSLLGPGAGGPPEPVPGPGRSVGAGSP